MKRKYKITEEQQQYRDSIIPKKRTYRKRRYEVFLPEPITRETYMSNCIFWIKEYYEKRADIERAKKAVLYLNQYCIEIFRELSNEL